MSHLDLRGTYFHHHPHFQASHLLKALYAVYYTEKETSRSFGKKVSYQRRHTCIIKVLLSITEKKKLSLLNKYFMFSKSLLIFH